VTQLLGVDTGGTFTDFVVDEGGRLRVHKVLSTPHAPEQAILQGIAELGLDLETLCVVHGSTVATNALLEGKGVRTLFITNRGLRDLLTIGRQARRELYNLQPPLVVPPVVAELCVETGGRLSAEGEMLEPLTESDLAALRTAVAELKPQAVAINLLFSFLDESAERAIEAVMPEGLFVSRSSEVLPEYREYERGIATWLNAYVGPLVDAYLTRLEAGVAPAPLSVMQSSGDTIDAAQAGRHAVRMLLSGPAGGLRGAQFIGRLAGCERLLTFDMGGTSTDVALIDGEVALTSEGRVADYPVGVPMVDMHTIGAGGGSIARVDDGGLLQVGPESAGADPGPACYGRGGHAATVTDANLVLGRLRADAFLGGGMVLDVAAAHAAVAAVAEGLGLTIEAAAEGVIRLANEHMARALRVISVARGIDPRDFTLTCFGGAGGLHVCALADALGMHSALVPLHGGVLSALGMLAAPRGRQLSKTVTGLLQGFDEQGLERHFVELIEQGERALLAEGVAEDSITLQRSVDLRYVGQAYTLTIPWLGAEESAAQFHLLHQQRYGHRLEMALELVNLRLGVSGPPSQLKLGEVRPLVATTTDLPLDDGVPCYRREALQAGELIVGPALITEQVSTTWLAAGWSCRADSYGNLLLSRS